MWSSTSHGHFCVCHVRLHFMAQETCTSTRSFAATRLIWRSSSRKAIWRISSPKCENRSLVKHLRTRRIRKPSWRGGCPCLTCSTYTFGGIHTKCSLSRQPEKRGRGRLAKSCALEWIRKVLRLNLHVKGNHEKGNLPNTWIYLWWNMMHNHSKIYFKIVRHGRYCSY